MFDSTNATQTAAAALLAHLRSMGVSLRPSGIRIVLQAPLGILTPSVLAVIRQHKDIVRELVQLEGPCARCGDGRFRDRSIHSGRSLRRDCATCGHTWGFPLWNLHRP